MGIDLNVLQADLLLLERDAAGLLQMLQVADSQGLVGKRSSTPSALYAAWAHRLRGEQAAARAAFDVARVRMDAAIGERPDDWQVHADRGLALAGLGRRDEALGEARWLQQSTIYREDPFFGPELAEARAGILAQTGDAGAALDEIERLLAGPSWLSVHTLRLDPRWDPIREHPRFKALLAKYGVETTQQPGAHALVGRIYLAQGKPDAALQEILQETAEQNRLYGLVMVYHALGRRAESDAALASYSEKYLDRFPYFVAALHAFRGEQDEAFVWLDRAYAERDRELTWMKVDLDLESLRKDPRWRPFLRKMRLTG